MSSRSRASMNRSRCSNLEVTVCCRESYSGLSQRDRAESFLSLCSHFPQERFSLVEKFLMGLSKHQCFWPLPQTESLPRRRDNARRFLTGFSLGRVVQCQRRQCRRPELCSYTFLETGHLRKSESCFSCSCSHYWPNL